MQTFNVSSAKIMSRSLAVLTDAAHLLSDVSGFGVSLWAAWYATRRSQETHTFGCASPLRAWTHKNVACATCISEDSCALDCCCC